MLTFAILAADSPRYTRYVGVRAEYGSLPPDALLAVERRFTRFSECRRSCRFRHRASSLGCARASEPPYQLEGYRPALSDQPTKGTLRVCPTDGLFACCGHFPRPRFLTVDHAGTHRYR